MLKKQQNLPDELGLEDDVLPLAALEICLVLKNTVHSQGGHPIELDHQAVVSGKKKTNVWHENHGLRHDLVVSKSHGFKIFKSLPTRYKKKLPKP